MQHVPLDEVEHLTCICLTFLGLMLFRREPAKHKQGTEQQQLGCL